MILKNSVQTVLKLPTCWRKFFQFAQSLQVKSEMLLRPIGNFLFNVKNLLLNLSTNPPAWKPGPAHPAIVASTNRSAALIQDASSGRSWIPGRLESRAEKMASRDWSICRVGRNSYIMDVFVSTMLY